MSDAAADATEEDRARWMRQATHFAERVSFNKACGLKVTRWDPHAVVMELPYAEWLCNSTHGVHGGVISALADTCGTAASLATLGTEGFIATVSMNVNYLSVATTDLIATGTCVKAGRRVQAAEVKIHDRNHKLIASATVTSMIP